MESGLNKVVLNTCLLKMAHIKNGLKIKTSLKLLYLKHFDFLFNHLKREIGTPPF